MTVDEIEKHIAIIISSSLEPAGKETEIEPSIPNSKTKKEMNKEKKEESVVVGVTAGLEEARANGNDGVDSDTINGLRAGLMGPVAADFIV